MANFEGLIRQALASQNASDPATRQRIYQSSRNALARMLEKSGNTGDDAVRLQFGKLEQSIASIEAEYALSSNQPPAESSSLDTSETLPEPAFTPAARSQASQAPSAPLPTEQAAPEDHAPEFAPAPVPEPFPAVSEEAEVEPVSTGVIDPEDVFASLRREEPAASAESQASSAPAPNAAPAPVPSSAPPSISAPSLSQAPSTGLPPDYKPAPLFPPMDEPAEEPGPAASSLSPLPPFEAASVPPAPTRYVEDSHPGSIPAGGGETRSEPVAEPRVRNLDAPTEFLEPRRNAVDEPEFDAGPLRADAGRPTPVRSEAQTEFETRETSDFGTAEMPSYERPVEPYLGDVTPQSREEPSYTGLDDQDIAADRELPPTYKRKHPLLRRIWAILLAIAVVLVILWIMYALLATRDTNGSQTGQAANGETSQAEDGSTFITLLQPTDLSALVTAGRGSADLITEQKSQMLRLKSIRQDGSTAANAEPILLELERGVLRQIEGKEVTVEFYAKSGGTGPAQFAVQCDIGGDSVCGRKRFRVGLQPERILFSLDLKDGFSTDDRAYLAINTDITNAAETTGAGDEIDIIHVRLRLNEN